MLEALKFFVSGQATNPYARQDAALRAREDASAPGARAICKARC